MATAACSIRAVQVDNLLGDSLGRGVVPGQLESGRVLGYFKRLDPLAAVEPGQVGQEAQVARVVGGGWRQPPGGDQLVRGP